MRPAFAAQRLRGRMAELDELSAWHDRGPGRRSAVLKGKYIHEEEVTAANRINLSVAFSINWRIFSVDLSHICRLRAAVMEAVHAFIPGLLVALSNFQHMTSDRKQLSEGSVACRGFLMQ